MSNKPPRIVVSMEGVNARILCTCHHEELVDASSGLALATHQVRRHVTEKHRAGSFYLITTGFEKELQEDG